MELIKELNEKICGFLKCTFNKCCCTIEISLNRHRINVIQNIQEEQTG